ncbi:MAG: hypothetical protein LRS46_03040 [Desulfurococcales archaeon]|nr:hypothetical protein [Desulfurococcales archaeon]
MPPRITLGWDRCDLCGRHAPTWKCRVGGKTLNICLFCAYTLSASCESLTLELPRRAPGPEKPVLEPDERVLEKYSKTVVGRGRRGSSRRYRGSRRSTR